MRVSSVDCWKEDKELPGVAILRCLLICSDFQVFTLFSSIHCFWIFTSTLLRARATRSAWIMHKQGLPGASGQKMHPRLRPGGYQLCAFNRSSHACQADSVDPGWSSDSEPERPSSRHAVRLAFALTRHAPITPGRAKVFHSSRAG